MIKFILADLSILKNELNQQDILRNQMIRMTDSDEVQSGKEVKSNVTNVLILCSREN
jgi:hypothetical protein